LEQRAYDILLVGVLFTKKLLEQRACKHNLLLVGVLFTNKLLEQRACKHNLLLVGVLFTNKLMEQHVYDEKVYTLLVFFSPTSFWSSAPMIYLLTPCWCSFHQQAYGAARL